MNQVVATITQGFHEEGDDEIMYDNSSDEETIDEGTSRALAQAGISRNSSRNMALFLAARNARNIAPFRKAPRQLTAVKVRFG